MHMRSMGRRILFVVILLAVLGFGYFTQMGKTSEIPPTAFLEARQQGSQISQDILNLSGEFSKDLERVNELDKEGKQMEALELSLGLQQKVSDIKAKAVELSRELEKMTSALNEIRTPAARMAAVDSITNRMALIGRLLSYGEYLNQLSIALKDRFQEKPGAPEISLIVGKINEEVTAINNFNKSAQDAMERFDEAIEKGK